MTESDVQNEKLNRIESKVDKLITKWDNFIDPKDGAFTKVTMFQASCPRRYMKYLWLVVVPIGIANITIAASLVYAVSKLGG